MTLEEIKQARHLRELNTAAIRTLREGDHDAMDLQLLGLLHRTNLILGLVLGQDLPQQEVSA